jgi:hypothetical protein
MRKGNLKYYFLAYLTNLDWLTRTETGVKPSGIVDFHVNTASDTNKLNRKRR